MDNILANLQESIYKGFIDHSQGRSSKHKPRLLINNVDTKETILSAIQEELLHCKDFFFSVAFITESGLATLKSNLWDMHQKGIKGRILTSTFLQFNQPKVFKELLKIPNVDVRLTSLRGFHSKGYIFKHSSHFSLIVGSSNLTAQALKANYEWNVKLDSHENGEIIRHFTQQFEEIWGEAIPLSLPWIEEYERTFELEQWRNRDRIVEMPLDYRVNSIEDALSVVPNKMQEAALASIEAVRDAGNKKTLIVSATGTGKTLLSAFDVRRVAPKKMLFIVHREQILQKAKEDYKLILGGPDRDFGIFTGHMKEMDARYIFATIQTLSRDEVLSQFVPGEFDYVLVDEVHKAGASTYVKVMNYFQPNFMMGMTATPERTDDFNIFELFDYNIAYEIRLQEALEEDMLCPFHYFGVTEYEHEGKLIDETTTLAKLVTEERVQHIMEKVNYYGHSGDRVRGLMFCSRKEEAVELSKALNDCGLRTVALLGNHSQDERLRRVEELERGALDYIITVDIFNEGVDIPSINQVVMLRQTQSSIIFIQQLGRGLRKHDSKEFVTIIDFIGNYKNNYLIPVALSGDRSQNKDSIRKKAKDTCYITGVSTINFEEVAKKQIFQSINDSKLTSMRILREAYIELKNRLGRVPTLLDFYINNSIDPAVIVAEHKNYYQFLVKVREEVPQLNDHQQAVLTMLSQEVLSGKRKHEIALLQLLMDEGVIEERRIIELWREKGYLTDDSTLISVQRILDLSFYTSASVKKYGDKPIVILEMDRFRWHPDVIESLLSNSYFYEQVKAILQVAEEKSKRYDNGKALTLHEKYSRKDACKLLNWLNDESSTMYGYKAKHGTCPIFVTYHKQEEVGSSINYGDTFLSQDVFQWYTRSNRTLRSEEVKKILNAEETNLILHLFVKKDNAEGTDFYYVGEATPDAETIEQTTMPGSDLSVVRMQFKLKEAVETSLYHYLIEE
ncbi:DUF3427 domain-containing protein [Bacillus sp. FJAT-45037]|uniref:DUF3427 domain-containing protein n=1 Tax=Bacillus sp. FJAT-45037 TaxID=2011007 RepID=UPI000C241BD1|nr:DEAD/DEAH box helicase [Bacillus sp. FJAT-45037]